LRKESVDEHQVAAMTKYKLEATDIAKVKLHFSVRGKRRAIELAKGPLEAAKPAPIEQWNLACT